MFPLAPLWLSTCATTAVVVLVVVTIVAKVKVKVGLKWWWCIALKRRPITQSYGASPAI